MSRRLAILCGPRDSKIQTLASRMKSNTRRLTAIACAVISAVPRIASSAPGDVDTAFDTKVGGLNTMAVQPNGKLLVSDSYIAAGGGIVGRIARLNIDGTSDTDFIAHEFIADPTANRNNGGYPIAVQADGKIVTVTTKNIARLYSNGTKDTSFNFNNNSARSGNYIDNISVQTDGKFVIGGNFTTVGGLTRNYVARVNANGTVDTGFNPNANESIFGTVAQPDGKLIIGGAFVKVGGVTRNRIARLNANGTLDTGFNPNVNERVWSMAVQADGKMVIGGEFTSVGGVTRNRIARINPDGTLDQGFHPNLSDKILTMAVQTDGKIIIGGLFRTVDGVVRNYILRLHPDGTLDRGFNPHATSTVHMLVVQADGKIVCNGTFSTVDGVTRTSMGAGQKSNRCWSGCASGGPEVVEPGLTQECGADVEEVFRSGLAPEHAGAFETRSDDFLAAGFHDP